MQGPDGRRALARLEDHADHSGLHAHAWCDGKEIPFGGPSMDPPSRLPRTRTPHRRAGMLWTQETFWVMACRTFGLVGADVDQGALL